MEGEANSLRKFKTLMSTVIVCIDANNDGRDSKRRIQAKPHQTSEQRAEIVRSRVVNQRSNDA